MDEKNNKPLAVLAKDEDGFVEIDGNLKYEVSESRGQTQVKSLRRKYQALRDFVLFAESASVLENYMELVIQFGYVILFG